MVWLAVIAAVAGAFFLAFGTQRQSSAVRAMSGGLNVTGLGMLRLFKIPRWVFGLVLLGIGMALNVYALASAPLTVVQPIGAIALVITTIVNAREHNIRMNRPTILAIIACMVGSMSFVLLAIKVSAEGHAITAREENITLLLLAGVVIIFGGLLAFVNHKLGAIFYILGAGILFGFVAVLVRTISLVVLNSAGNLLANVPWLAVVAVVVAGLLGSYFVQNAYSKGPPDLVVAGLTVIDPMVGIAIGIGIFGELAPNVRPAVALSMVVAGCIAIVGVIALSRHHPDVLERRAEAKRKLKISDGS